MVKNCMLSLKVRDTGELYTLTTAISHFTGGRSQCNKEGEKM